MGAFMPHPARVLVVSGASRPESNVLTICRLASEQATKAGAQVRVTDLATQPVPIMQYGNSTQAEMDAVIRLRENAVWAEGFLIVTPEYHGNMSGALKNWFDFLWKELAGKFAGVMAVTGGGSGDMSIVSVKNCFAWCHGFTLPFHAAARKPDFDEQGNLLNDKVADRISRIAHDVVRYAPVLRSAFDDARKLGDQVEAGVAGLHVED